MIGTRRLMSRSGLVRMLCALSLLLVAFAHKPIVSSATAAAYADVNIAEFVLPDGTLPDLCLDSGKTGEHASAGHCEACRIVSSVDLPSPFGAYLINRWSAGADLAVALNARVTHPVLRPSASPRGPPSFTA